jgi:hypothetical protein
VMTMTWSSSRFILIAIGFSLSDLELQRPSRSIDPRPAEHNLPDAAGFSL